MDEGDRCSTINVIQVDSSTPDAEDKVADTYTLTVQMLSESSMNVSLQKEREKKSKKRCFGCLRKKKRKSKSAKPVCTACGRGAGPCLRERIQKRRQYGQVLPPQYQVYDYCSEKCTEEMPPAKLATPLVLAVTLQLNLRPFYTFCHGLLAGLGLTHSILAGSVHSEVEMRWLLESYYLISMKIHCTYYFLAVICLLSILDRFDLAHMNFFHISHLIRYRSLDCIMFLLYLFVLMATSVAFRWDQRMATPIFDGVWWRDLEELIIEFGAWKAMSLCRGIGAILGWMCLMLCEGEDMLHLHLANLIKYQS